MNAVPTKSLNSSVGCDKYTDTKEWIRRPTVSYNKYGMLDDSYRVGGTLQLPILLQYY